MIAKIKDFWVKYEHKVVLVLGFVLVAVLSFEAGILKGQRIEQNPVVVKGAEISASCEGSQENASRSSNLPSSEAVRPEKDNTAGQNCAFVGSKNSNKYHLPTCQWAKRIKPENIVCFKDENEAKSPR